MMFTLPTKIDFNLRNLELKLSMQDITFVNAITGEEKTLRVRLPGPLAASYLKRQSSVNRAAT